MRVMVNKKKTYFFQSSKFLLKCKRIIYIWVSLESENIKLNICRHIFPPQVYQSVVVRLFSITIQNAGNGEHSKIYGKTVLHCHTISPITLHVFLKNSTRR